MKKHPLNKRIRSSAPTETELTSPNARVRHRAIVRLGRHRNIISRRKEGHRPALNLVGDAA